MPKTYTGWNPTGTFAIIERVKSAGHVGLQPCRDRAEIWPIILFGKRPDMRNHNLVLLSPDQNNHGILMLKSHLISCGNPVEGIIYVFTEC